MILNCSGRTDICAFYSKWFYHRVKEGFVDVRNPYDPKQVQRIILDSNHVDAIVFCTKNPLPFLPYLEEIPFPLLFQVTLTPYQKEVEPYVFDKRKVLEAVQFLSSKLGEDHVVVRYDPIFLSPTYPMSYHRKAFSKLCRQLEGFVSTIIISFLDLKKNTVRHAQELQLLPLGEKEMREIASIFAPIAQRYGIHLQTCCEEVDLSLYNISQTSCVNQMTMERLLGYHKSYRKSTTRKGCHCIETIDIGAYNSCPHFCRYCYANFLEEEVLERVKKHDENSSFLLGTKEKGDILKVRVESSERQMILPLK